MNEQVPYVVDNRWIVYARNTMEATMTYRTQCDPNKWPVVRQATSADVARLPSLAPADTRRAA